MMEKTIEQLQDENEFLRKREESLVTADIQIKGEENKRRQEQQNQ